MRLYRGPPRVCDRMPEIITRCASLQRRIHNVRCDEIMKTMRVMRVLETRAHQNIRITTTQIDRAIAMMHIEIQNRDTLDPWQAQRIDRGNRYAIKQTKPHGRVKFSVMTRWPDRTEHPRLRTFDHIPHTLPYGTRGLQRG